MQKSVRTRRGETLQWESSSRTALSTVAALEVCSDQAEKLISHGLRSCILHLGAVALVTTPLAVARRTPPRRHHTNVSSPDSAGTLIHSCTRTRSVLLRPLWRLVLPLLLGLVALLLRLVHGGLGVLRWRVDCEEAERGGAGVDDCGTSAGESSASARVGRDREQVFVTTRTAGQWQGYRRGKGQVASLQEREGGIGEREGGSVSPRERRCQAA